MIGKEVREFVNAMEEAEEVELGVVECALRMINGVFIVHNLTSESQVAVLSGIEGMKEAEMRQTFDRCADLLFELD